MISKNSPTKEFLDSTHKKYMDDLLAILENVDGFVLLCVTSGRVGEVKDGVVRMAFGELSMADIVKFGFESVDFTKNMVKEISASFEEAQEYTTPVTH